MSASAKTKTTATQPLVITEEHAASLVPVRARDAHKWSVGGVLVVGGSPGYIGAPALSALAAGRSGAGIVSIATPRGAMGAIAAIVPEASFLPLPEGDLGIGGERAASRVRERLEKFRALVVGPGLGDDEYADDIMQGLTGIAETKATLHVGFSVGSKQPEAPSRQEQAAILGSGLPAVIDADGLNWLAKQGEDWAGRFTPGTLVLTPHIGEMSRLTGEEPEALLADPAAAARKYAAQWKQTVVLKGSPTVVTDGDSVLVAASTPRSLATAGSGDVLAGSIAAFLAQGLAPIDAAALGVYVGTEAANALAARFGTLGLVATDLPVAIAEALGRLEQKKGK